jgi:hypothetical protein
MSPPLPPHTPTRTHRGAKIKNPRSIYEIVGRYISKSLGSGITINVPLILKVRDIFFRDLFDLLTPSKKILRNAPLYVLPQTKKIIPLHFQNKRYIGIFMSLRKRDKERERGGRERERREKERKRKLEREREKDQERDRDQERERERVKEKMNEKEGERKCRRLYF